MRRLHKVQVTLTAVFVRWTFLFFIDQGIISYWENSIVKFKIIRYIHFSIVLILMSSNFEIWFFKISLEEIIGLNHLWLCDCQKLSRTYEFKVTYLISYVYRVPITDHSVLKLWIRSNYEMICIIDLFLRYFFLLLLFN